MTALVRTCITIKHHMDKGLDMSEEPGSRDKSVIPYFASDGFEIPESLIKHTKELPGAGEAEWLILPYEAVADEPYQEYALGIFGTDLRIVAAVPVEGQTEFRIESADCVAVRFESRLLLSRVTFFKKSGQVVSLQYNATGDVLVRKLIEPLLHEVLTGAENINGAYRKTGEPGYSTAFSRAFNTAFEKSPALATAVQPATVYQTVKRWFSRNITTVPASAVGVSTNMVVVATAAFGGKADKYAQSLTMVPIDCVTSLDLLEPDGETAGVQISFGAGETMSVVFSTLLNPEITERAMQVRTAYEVVVGERASLAQQELLRLTGVDLPGQEAVEALAQIHKYKWLEAERAGFDTWAVIQPENPLRAAAVHWVRKHFGQFEQAMHHGAA